MESTGHAKQDSISASLSFVNLIYETHSVFFSLPKKLFTASFCVKNVLPHAVRPTIRIFPTNFPS